MGNWLAEHGVTLGGFLLSCGVAVRAWLRAADASVRAKAASDRADEALEMGSTLAFRIQMHLVGREEQEIAQREAGHFVDLWEGEIREHISRPGGERHALQLVVDSLAKEIALSRLRERKESLNIVMIDHRPGQTRAAIIVRKPPRGRVTLKRSRLE